MSGKRNVLKQKTAGIIKILEQTFGMPTLSKRRAKPLDMLIATVLSQNTNDLNSHRAYLHLRKQFPSWNNVLAAPRARIVSAIRVGGIANRKSVQIKYLLQRVKELFGTLSLRSLAKKSDEEVFNLLISLDGVGTKTASCVLLFSLGRDAFPVDTHVHRICGRLGLASGCKNPDQTFEWMKGLLPKGKSYSFHINLIRFGRKICKSNRPLCGMCPLFDVCRFKQKNMFRKLSSAAVSTRDYNFMLLDHV